MHAIPEQAVALRHALHQVPELSGEEYETGRLIRAALADLPLQWLPAKLGTDVVAILHGAHPGPNVTLRADIDALPIEEATGLAYASAHPGRMHACGHDGHAAILAGAARALAARRDELHGSVRFVWQPGEEMTALGRSLVDADALEDPAPVLVAALHGWPGLPVGHIMTGPGPMMAACTDFFIEITGRGGHGSAPEKARDVVYAGSLLVTALQSVVSRNVAPLDAAVLSVGSFHSGGHPNVLPERADLSGTLRYFRPELGEELRSAVRRVADGIAGATGTRIEAEFRNLYEPTINDARCAERAKKAAEAGATGYLALERPALAAEDFSFYLRRYPGVYAWIGLGEGSVPLHTSDFDFNDEALAPGIGYLVALALDVLTR